ncbi:hypothetical protein [Fulvivirga lutimaris]|uniref:hypothetical protein n=1 Tax=Fulvivirga lutimaris TaxID=1819566 RepID=UPI0012BB9B8C|nr:hypothetical protein [Fulvivirga lutimaris]MTI41653.1 hypothetical protein [Fulvivirga lutimaris]
MDIKTDSKHKIAEEFFQKASEGLYKPEEDVVAYSVCKNAFYAAKNYLISFLEEQGIENSEDDSLEELLNKCRSVNDKFADLHLSPMYHPTDTEDVWMNVDAASDYVKMAENTRQVILKK